MYFYFRPHGMGFHREMKWVGSYRYAVINLSADHLGQLERDYETVLDLLGWRQAKELSHSLSHSQSA